MGWTNAVTEGPDPSKTGSCLELGVAVIAFRVVIYSVYWAGSEREEV